jgi:hypothetical protein
MTRHDSHVMMALVWMQMTYIGTAVEIIRSVTPSTYTPKTTGFIDWIVFHASAGEVYEAQVITPSATAARYRLMVLGTGFKQGVSGKEVDVDMFNHLNIMGPHQYNFCSYAPQAC